MSSALLLDILRTIRRSLNRFISIILITALGAGIFVGMKATSPSMQSTVNEYFESNNLMDIRVQSTIGLSLSDVDTIRGIDGVEGVMGAKFADALVLVNGKPEIDIDGTQISTRAYSINLTQLQEYYYGVDNNNFINRPSLLEGTYPTKSNQCLVDASALSTPESYKIGNTITLEADSNADLSGLAVTEFEIVGIISSPYYLSFERGNSLVGSGKIGTYIYIPEAAFTSDYYSEIYVTVKGADEYSTDSEEYKQCVSAVSDKISAASASAVTKRADELRNTLPTQILNAQQQYNTAYETINTNLKSAEEQIAIYQHYVDDPEGAYNEAVSKAAEALGVAENEFNGSTSEYYAAVEQYNTMLEEYKAARKAQEDMYDQLTEAQNQYNQAESMLTSAQTAKNTANQLVTSTKSVVESANSILTSLEAYQNGQMDSSELAAVLSTLQSINPDLYASISSLSAVSMATEAIALINPYLEQQKSQLAVYEEQLEDAQTTLDGYYTQCQQAALILASAKESYNNADEKLDAAYEELNAIYNQIEGSQSQLTSAQIELMINQNAVSSDLDTLKTVIAGASTYLEKAKEQYNSLKATAEKELTIAENKIKNAKETYLKLDSAKWNVYDRNDTPGYSSYVDAIDSVSVLSNIFPLIFIIVAALVCLTTMSRMVEEERTQIGAFKALGYSNNSIIAKYIIYALFASIIGSALGTLIGIYSLPYAISQAYSIMFTIPIFNYEFPVSYILAGVLISVITTILAATVAAVKELRVNSAALMRPKAPKPGKRVLLERIGFIWKRISFTGKVTIRNLFRKKTRLIMTVLGIGGCTALILASCGLYTSINGLMKAQYDNGGIADYDIQIVFSGNQTEDSEIMKTLNSDSRITSLMLASIQSVTGGSERTDNTEDIYLFVPKDSAKLSEYINLQNRVSGEKLTLDSTGAIITEQFAKNTDTDIGDRVWIETADGEKIDIPVAGITENYTFSYIYLSEDLYQYLFQKTVNYNYAVGNVADAILQDTQTTDNTATKKSLLATDLMSYSQINAVAYVTDTIDTLNEVINVLSIIILIFIVAAGMLAFIVLYNLSNINISERQRELATIKVLGFHDKEVSSYIYRENIILTVFGILFGLVFGIFVHKLLITYCAVDTVMYVQTLDWYNYVIAVLITALFAIIVNLIMHRKMTAIDMVTSLKAIE
ncbi:MAG: FtsX-like permease family protein [Clostridia bacterium]|nr:FtsX-like permease family protein [Clostridia bacterium]